MSDLSVQDKTKKRSPSISPSPNGHSPQYFTPLTSPKMSMISSDESNKSPERPSLLRRLTYPFRRSLRHENQPDKDQAKTNFHSIKKYSFHEPDDFIRTERTGSQSDTIDCRDLLGRISTLWLGTNTDRGQAFDLLEQNRVKCAMLPEFLARFSYSLSKRALDISDESLQKSMLHEALELSKTALKSNENCALCHFAYGHILGVLIERNQFSLKEKLHEALSFKFHMDKSIELDPNFYEAYAYLGRYEYTAWNLNIFERKAASMLGYTIEGNLDKALEYFHRAVQGNGDMFHTVYLLIGKIYQKKKQYSEAKKYFNMCVEIPIERKSQTEIVNEAKILLKNKKIENSSFETFISN